MLSPDQDPNRQSTLRKLRAFMGFLMNTEEALRAGGFALGEAYAYALAEYDRLEQLEQQVARNDAVLTREWHRCKQLSETSLLHRWDDALAFLQTHAPGHSLLPHYLAYRACWRLETSDPTLHAKGGFARPDGQLLTFGVPLERLLHLHARLAALPVPDEFVRSYAIFLAGLKYALSCQTSSGAVRAHQVDDELHSISARCLQVTAQFALQAEPQNLARTAARLPEDTAFHCLFMGIAYLQANCEELAGDWLRRGVDQENRLRLLFAVGVQSLAATTARRLVGPIQPHLLRLVWRHLGPEIGKCLEQFAVERG